jgi:hypothetical protein
MAASEFLLNIASALLVLPQERFSLNPQNCPDLVCRFDNLREVQVIALWQQADSSRLRILQAQGHHAA